MLNFTRDQGEAKIHYGASDYIILNAGAFVRCAVTGDKILLEDLKYWNDELQEAYCDARASTKRLLENKS
ncbi:MAG: DUF2093 domain-containing protein [Robiginitomaculum sp.]